MSEDIMLVKHKSNAIKRAITALAKAVRENRKKIHDNLMKEQYTSLSAEIDVHTNSVYVKVRTYDSAEGIHCFETVYEMTLQIGG